MRVSTPLAVALGRWAPSSDRANACTWGLSSAVAVVAGVAACSGVAMVFGSIAKHSMFLRDSADLIRFVRWYSKTYLSSTPNITNSFCLAVLEKIKSDELLVGMLV